MRMAHLRPQCTPISQKSNNHDAEDARLRSPRRKAAPAFFRSTPLPVRHDSRSLNSASHERAIDLSEYEKYHDGYHQLGRFLDEGYMHKRIYSSLGHLTPAEFEGQWLAQLEVTACRLPQTAARCCQRWPCKSYTLETGPCERYFCSA